MRQREEVDPLPALPRPGHDWVGRSATMTTTDDSRPEHRLAEVSLFAGLSPAVLDELASVSRVRRYPAGQILWSEGDPGDALLVLEDGQLRVSRMGADGQEVVLAVVEPPAALGELALLDGAPRDASVVAQRAVSVRLVPRQAFLGLLRREPSVVEGLLKALAGMVRVANARHARTVGLDVPGRLAAWLLDRAKAAGTPGIHGAVVVVLDRSQGELAAELGTTRSTLNRALKEFEDLGLLKIEGERVVIRHPAALEPYAG
jgi:CRP-like cAMP-binding protein